jgi:hypothetical protein
VDPIGLDAAFAGLKNVVREGDANADTNRSAFDFYSPDTFNYASLNISADGSTLSVNVKGINSYATNTFPQPSSANAVRDILSFDIGLEKTALTVAQSVGVLGGTTTLSATLTDSDTSAPLAGKVVSFTLGGQVIGVATTDSHGVVTIPNVSIASYAVGAYPGEIQASFNGDVSTLKAAGTGDLVVEYAVVNTTNKTKPAKSGSTIPIELLVNDTAGNNVGSSSVPVKAVSVVGSDGKTYPVNDAGNSNAGGLFRYDPGSGTYKFNLKTTGLKSGTYTLSFTIGDDPTLHTVTFEIK